MPAYPSLITVPLTVKCKKFQYFQVIDRWGKRHMESLFSISRLVTIIMFTYLHIALCCAYGTVILENWHTYWYGVATFLFSFLDFCFLLRHSQAPSYFIMFSRMWKNISHHHPWYVTLPNPTVTLNQNAWSLLKYIFSICPCGSTLWVVCGPLCHVVIFVELNVPTLKFLSIILLLIVHINWQELACLF